MYSLSQWSARAYSTACVLLLVPGLYGCLGTNTPDERLQDVVEITTKFAQTMIDCPERIWADYSWNGFKVALVYPSSENSWVWDASSNELAEIGNHELPRPSLTSGFAFFEMDGQPTMSLNMEHDQENDDVFRLGVHEFFHDQGQIGWNRGAMGRGTPYPVLAEPRLYRRMMLDNLKRYLEYADPDDLGRVRYWYELWADDPLELSLTTDQIEGTAFYMEFFASVLAERGCWVSDAELRLAAIERAKSVFGFSVSGEKFQLDLEGYDIGGLAALILRFDRKPLREWNQEIAEGETPLTVLLREVAPKIDEGPPQHLVELFGETAQRVNEELGSLVDVAIDSWPDASFIRLSSPIDYLMSNFSPSAFIYSRVLETELFPLGRDHPFLSPTSDYILREGAVVRADWIPACEFFGFMNLVPEASIHVVDGVAELASGTVSGRLAGQMKDEAGFRYFCVQ